MGIRAFALIVCNNSYVFAHKTCNVNASFKYKMYLELVKGRGGAGSPGHSYCLGMSPEETLGWCTLPQAVGLMWRVYLQG